MDNIISLRHGHMRQGHLPEMDSPRQEIVFQILGHPCNSCPFKGIIDWQHTIAGSKEIYIELTIDEPAQKVENMRRGSLGAGHDIESGIEDTRHNLII